MKKPKGHYAIVLPTSVRRFVRCDGHEPTNVLCIVNIYTSKSKAEEQARRFLPRGTVVHAVRFEPLRLAERVWPEPSIIEKLAALA